MNSHNWTQIELVHMLGLFAAISLVVMFSQSGITGAAELPIYDISAVINENTFVFVQGNPISASEVPEKTPFKLSFELRNNGNAPTQPFYEVNFGPVHGKGQGKNLMPGQSAKISMSLPGLPAGKYTFILKASPDPNQGIDVNPADNDLQRTIIISSKAVAVATPKVPEEKTSIDSEIPLKKMPNIVKEKYDVSVSIDENALAQAEYKEYSINNMPANVLYTVYFDIQNVGDIKAQPNYEIKIGDVISKDNTKQLIYPGGHMRISKLMPQMKAGSYSSSIKAVPTEAFNEGPDANIGNNEKKFTAIFTEKEGSNTWLDFDKNNGIIQNGIANDGLHIKEGEKFSIKLKANNKGFKEYLSPPINSVIFNKERTKNIGTMSRQFINDIANGGSSAVQFDFGPLSFGEYFIDFFLQNAASESYIEDNKLSVPIIVVSTTQLKNPFPFEPFKEPEIKSAQKDFDVLLLQSSTAVFDDYISKHRLENVIDMEIVISKIGKAPDKIPITIKYGDKKETIDWPFSSGTGIIHRLTINDRNKFPTHIYVYAEVDDKDISNNGIVIPVVLKKDGKMYNFK